MSHIALYRKYRPSNFDEVVGQEIVVKILKNSIINNKINHAYIFSGPKGTGKTSVAKIFSRAVNCLKNTNGNLCKKCDACLKKDSELVDIIEIDAASNNGVDEIREIINNVNILPNYLKYKVFIIDEVHMLSSSAFNALLKTLEEPPSHIIFILATTEIHKIPSTVLSRCQKLDFKKISNNKMKNHLKTILNNESKSLSDDVLDLIIENSDGAFRDAINLMEQILNYGTNLSVNDICNLFGIISKESTINLFDCIIKNDISKGLEIINDYYENGINLSNVSNSLLSLITNIIINNNTHDYFETNTQNLLENYLNIDDSKLINISKILFELTSNIKKNINTKNVFENYFINMCITFNKNSLNDLENKINENKIEIKEENKNDINISNDYKNMIINNSLATADKNFKKTLLEKMNKLDEFISDTKYSTIVNLLHKSSIQVASNKYVLFSCLNDFEVILFNKNLEKVESLLKKITNEKIYAFAITTNEWNILKAKYINDLKFGIKYEEKEMPNLNNDYQPKELEKIFGENILNIE